MANQTVNWTNPFEEWTSISLDASDCAWFGVYILAYIAISIVAYVFLSSRQTSNVIEDGKRILLVIAHPDDECMFFGPTIISLTSVNAKRVYLLCLSRGDYRGEGKQREIELWDSCRNLGILSENITLMHCDIFPDDPNKNWNVERLGEIIVNHIKIYDIDRLLTFDDDGVSGHANHSALYAAALRTIALKRLPKDCRVFALDTVGVFRKYVAFLDVIPAWIGHDILFVGAIKVRRKVVEAMQAHASQMLWFRKLYVIASRYMFINGYTEVTDDFNLDLR